MRGRVLVGAFAVAAALGAAVAVQIRDRGGTADPEGSAEIEGRPLDPAAPTLAAAPRAARPVVPGTCVLVGTVHEGDAGGRPVAAKVSTWREVPFQGGKAVPEARQAWRRGPRDVTTGTPDATGTSDAAGRFEITGLAPGQYVVVAQTDATPPMRGLDSTTIRFDRDRERVDLVVRPAGLALVVRARRADGSPWRVRVGVDGSASRPVADTDESGAATLSGLAAGETEVQVFAPAQGFLLSVSVRLPHDGPLVVTEPAGLVSLSGRVVEAPGGAALPSAGVSASTSTPQGWTVSSAEAGADGAFRLLVDPGADTVEATAIGFADGEAKLHGKTTDLTIALHRTARVSGTVVEASTRKPVAGVRVLADGPDKEGAFGRLREFVVQDPLRASLGTTMTDESGRYALEVDAAGPVELRAIGSGWCSRGLGQQNGTGSTSVEVSAGAESVVTLVVERAAKVTGRVLDAQGKPAPGALVEAVVQQATTRRRPWDEAKAGLPATAGEDGAFVLDAVLPGVEVAVHASHGGVDGPAVIVGALEPGAQREVELGLARTRTVVVTVVGAADGKPVPGATVTLNGRNDRWQEETTDATGMVTFRGVSAGALVADANRPDPNDPARTVHRMSGDATAQIPAVPDTSVALPDANVTLRLGGADAAADGQRTLSGTVRFPDGTPAAGATVTAMRDEDQAVSVRRGRYVRWGDAEDTSTGTDGAFRLEVGNGDAVRLRASIARLGVDWTGTVAAAPGAKDVAITVTDRKDDDPAKVRVRVVDPQGTPVAAATAEVKLSTGSGSSESETEVAEGVLEFGVTPFETVEIRITKARDAVGARLPVAFAKIGPVPVARLPSEIRLAAEKTIEGFVRSPDGSPVAGVTVSAQPVEDESDPGASARRALGRVYGRFVGNGTEVANARSGSDGAFRLLGLEGSEYRIVPVTPRGYVDEGERDLRARGGATGLLVTLRPGIGVVLRVVDADGRPLAGAAVDAEASSAGQHVENEFARQFRRHAMRSGWLEGHTSDAGGAIRLDGLDAAATYTLLVDPPGDRRDLRPWQVAGWKPADGTIRLERARSTRGVVRSQSGEPLEGAYVEWSLSGKGEQSEAVETGEDGSFVVEHTEEGEIAFTATYGACTSESKASKAIVRVPAGTQDVALVVDAGAELSVRFDPALPPPQEVSIAADGGEPGLEEGYPVQTAGGVHRFRGLRADRTYTVWASTRRPSLVVLASGLRASSGAGPAREPYVLHRVPGGSITVRVVGPDGIGQVEVTGQRGPASVSQDSSRGGATRTVRLDGLFEGRWRIEARGSVGGVRYRGRADADVGGEVEVRLEPER